MRDSPDLIVHGRAPYNAEPRLDRLREAFVTPQRLLYVRSHGDIPSIDASTHRVVVDGLVARPLDFTLGALQARFAPRSVKALMQCAGNRRADMRQVRPVMGDPWAGGAIGHAEWTGVALAEVLRAAGVEERPGLHVAFTALDMCPCGGSPEPYGVSIPLAKAMTGDVLFAHAMNGEPLTPEHGYPLRVVVPGYAGARSPKWLGRVTVQDGPSAAYFQAADYKLFPPDMRKETEDLSRGLTIDEMPVNSAICVPAPGARLAAGPVTIRGYAAASGRKIARVDLSGDGGRGWMQAEIEPHEGSDWSWTFWSGTLDLSAGDHDLCVRAWDSAGQTQPARPDDTWNFKGYLSAAWHRVRVTVT